MLRIKSSRHILLIASSILVISFCLIYFQKTEQSHLNVTTVPYEQLNNIRLIEWTIIASKKETFFKTIKIGDIIVANVHSNTPNGFLGKVIRIKESSDSIFIDTEPVALNTVIQQGSIQVSDQLNTKDLQK